MSTVVQRIKGRVFAHDPGLRGYHVVYRPHEPNHCPGCGKSQWIVGRTTAECAFCATAMPLADPGTTGTGLFRISHFHPDEALAA